MGGTRPDQSTGRRRQGLSPRGRGNLYPGCGDAVADGSIPKAEGVTPYIGKQGGAALKAIRPAEELLDRTTHRPSDCRPARSVGE